MEIFHNPRCRKSREGLAILQESGKDFEVVEYLKDVPTAEALAEIINKLGIAPIELVRKNEAIWKEEFKGKELNDSEIVEAMVRYPKLIERPIVVDGARAVLGRPPEKIEDFIGG